MYKYSALWVICTTSAMSFIWILTIHWDFMSALAGLQNSALYSDSGVI